MQKIITFSLVTTVLLGTSSVYASDLSTQILDDAKVSGNLRTLHTSYKNDNEKNQDATAVGLSLKYELESYQGFNGAIAFVTSRDIDALSGDQKNKKRSDELSGTREFYTNLTEIYVNYKYNSFNFCLGRQVLDTPLVDSDDIRIISNTFEAYTSSYETDKFSLIVGHIEKWQGTDAGLEINNPWKKTGKDGVNFTGLNYKDSTFQTNIWFYNFSNNLEDNGNNAFYIDFLTEYKVQENIDINFGIQYLSENELEHSGIKANIYGFMSEFIMDDLSINIAYNKSEKERNKHSFSGYGGGTLFTNMDTMILDEITEDREAEAFLIGFNYEISKFNLSYIYGDFSANADSKGNRAHVIEQDIGVDYGLNKNLTFSSIYVIDENKEDKKSIDFNHHNFRFLISYTF